MHFLILFLLCVEGAEVRRLMNKAFKAPLVLQQQQVIVIIIITTCIIIIDCNSFFHSYKHTKLVMLNCCLTKISWSPKVRHYEI